MANIRVSIAQRISDDSWLNEDRFAEFRKGYEYACTQTNAIPALSKCHPTEMYHAFAAILHGMKRED